MNNNVEVKTDGKHTWTVKDLRDNTIKDLTYYQILSQGISNFLIPGANRGEWYRIAKSEEIPPEPVRCIMVNSEDHLYAVNRKVLTHNTGSGKSVLQRNVVFHCVMHSNDIKFLGIDLKQVELSPYMKYSTAVLGVATTLTDAVSLLTYANKIMNERYAQMKGTGFNNFIDLPNHGPAVLIMVDEAGQLLDTSGNKSSDAMKAETELKAQAQSIISSIARLGRAAGVHIMLATQRPDAKLIPGELKENLMFRAGCGHITSTASSMLFDDNTGTKTPASPKGRAAVMNVGQKPQNIQVYYTKSASWLEDLLKERGLNPDLTPISTGPSVSKDSTDIDSLQNIVLDNNGNEVDAIKKQRQAQAEAHEQAVKNLNSQQGESDVEQLGKLELKGDVEQYDPDKDWDDDMDELVED